MIRGSRWCAFGVLVLNVACAQSRSSPPQRQPPTEQTPQVAGTEAESADSRIEPSAASSPSLFRVTHLISPHLALAEDQTIRCRKGRPCPLQGVRPTLVARSSFVSDDGRVYYLYLDKMVSLPAAFSMPVQAVDGLGWAVQDAKGAT